MLLSQSPVTALQVAALGLNTDKEIERANEEGIRVELLDGEAILSWPRGISYHD